MKRSWYQTSKQCTALRKHVLRVDLCVFIDEEKVFSDENYLNSTIKSILTAAIIKGLDIIGILTPKNPSIGWKAVQMAKTQQMDIVVVPGQTYICQEGIELYIYNMCYNLFLKFYLLKFYLLSCKCDCTRIYIFLLNI